MPRTFSRGQRFTANKLFVLLQYLTDAENEEYVRQARILWCPEPPLEEQEIIKPILDMMQKMLTLNQHLFEFHTDTVTEDFRVHEQYFNLRLEMLDHVEFISASFSEQGVV